MRQKLLLFIAMLCVSVASAQTIIHDGISYTVISGTNVQVDTRQCYSGALTLPSTIKDGNITYTLTEIGNTAFIDCGTLTSVVIPNTVTVIREGAFLECGQLNSVEIPNSVTTIEGFVFKECYNLRSITIPKSVTSIGTNAFTDCPNLTSFTCAIKYPLVIDQNFFGGTTNIANCDLFVTASRINDYKAASIWKNFKSIQAIPQVVPTFTQVAPVCSGATLAALPTTSTNSIVGTWSPAINNTATTTYTFTPTDPNYATTTMEIVVNEKPTVAIGEPKVAFCADAIMPITVIGEEIITTNGFQGDYAPSNWTYTGINGEVRTNSAPNSISIRRDMWFDAENGGNGGISDSSDNSYAIVFPSAVTLSFNWDLHSPFMLDNVFPQIIVNGVATTLQNNNDDDFGPVQFGSMTVTVPAGQTFAFNMHATGDSDFADFRISDLVIKTTASGVSYTWETTNGGTIAGQPTLVAITPETSGTYTVTATNANGCTATDSVELTINAVPEAPTATAQSFCGSATVADLVATGDKGTLNWYDVATEGTALVSTTALKTGTYYVSEIGTGECESERTSVAVTMNEKPTVDAGEAKVAFCADAITPITIIGKEIITTNGFQGDYAPSNWTFSGVHGELLTGEAPNSIDIFARSMSTGGTESIDDSSDTSYAIVFPSTVTLSFNWDLGNLQGIENSFNQIIINGIATTLKKNDNYDTHQSGSMTVTVPAGQPFAFNLHTTGSLFYQTRFNITDLVISTIPEELTYSWAATEGGSITGASNAASVTPATSGTYTVTATATNGCTATDSVAITINPVPNAPTATAQSFCGSATVDDLVAIGDKGTLNWYDVATEGTTLESTIALKTGTYYVSETNASGCESKRTSVAVTLNKAANSSISSQTNIACNGGSNGSATVSASGGTAPYTYKWSTNATTATINGLIAGTYSVTVTEATGCTSTASVTITEPAALVATASAQTNLSCNGGSNGSATVAASGGTSGYTYSWAPSGGTAATASGLSAGTYTVTITDANACTTTKSFTITEPAAIVATASALTNVSCNGGSNGSATVAASGGTPSYTYSWAPSGGTAATASGLSAGTYTVTITDANSCTATKSFTITEPAALVATASAQTNVSCNGGSNGSATVAASGGTPGYTYSWAPSGGTAATAIGLSQGTYVVTITDANGCTETQSVTILEPTALSFTTTTLPSYNYNTDYSQSIVVAGGTGTKTYVVTAGSLPSGISLSSNGVISGTSTQIATSTFTVKVTDANSCTATYAYTLKINQIPVTVTVAASQTKAYGTTDPIFTYTVSPSLSGSDTFTGALSRVAGENVDSYAITQGTLSAGSNYLITFVPANFVITKADQTITWNQTLGLGCDSAINTIVLTATSTSGLPVSYGSSNATVGTISNNVYTLANYGAATITASQGGNANYNAATVVVLPVVNYQPNLIRKQFENVIFFDNSSNSFNAYSWYKDGILVAGQTAQYYTENSALNGTYYVVAKKIDGTSITTCDLTLSPSLEPEYIKVVPNPVKMNANYELITNVPTAKLQNARVEIFNVAGVLLETRIITDGVINMTAPTVNGIYIVKLTLENGKYFTKNLLVKN